MKTFHPFQFFKKFLPKTLFGRSLLIILLPLIIVQIITTSIFIDRHWSWVTRHLGRRMAAQMATVVEAHERNDDRLKLISKRFDFRLLQSHVRPEFTKISEKQMPLINRYLVRYLKQELCYPFEVISSDQMIHLCVQLPDTWLTVSTPRKFLFSMTTPIFLIWSFCTPFLFFIIAAIFMRNQIRPIRKLADAVHKFGRGELNIEIQPSGADEIRRAAVAFRVMQQRIQRQIQMRTEMLAGVSHDMRTPLTRMELSLAMMRDSDKKRELLKDVREMTATVSSYLAFARGEDGEATEEHNFEDLLRDCLSNLPEANYTLNLSLEKHIKLRSRYNNLKRGLTNIIENAQRYAPHMWIHAHASTEHVYLTIEDNGPGIPPDARLDVFKPFFRLEPSRNSQTGGTGLGLTIAREAIVGHGGTITLADSTAHHGLAVHIRIPL